MSKKRPVMHKVFRFVAKVPLTECGVYVESERATADPKLVTCQRNGCRRSRAATMKRNKALPAVGGDGPPWEAFVVTGAWWNDDNQLEGGRNLSRCHHGHRDQRAALNCALKLWHRRCPARYRERWR